jgi:hypothetical protein
MDHLMTMAKNTNYVVYDIKLCCLKHLTNHDTKYGIKDKG